VCYIHSLFIFFLGPVANFLYIYYLFTQFGCRTGIEYDMCTTLASCSNTVCITFCDIWSMFRARSSYMFIFHIQYVYTSLYIFISWFSQVQSFTFTPAHWKSHREMLTTLLYNAVYLYVRSCVRGNRHLTTEPEVWSYGLNRKSWRLW